jgi:galactokinase/mevalonate kinase-like predicted kinase
MFRGTLPPAKYLGSSLTIQVGLGNGQTIIKRLRLDEVEIAELERQIDPRDGGPQVTSKTEVAIPLDEV